MLTAIVCDFHIVCRNHHALCLNGKCLSPVSSGNLIVACIIACECRCCSVRTRSCIHLCFGSAYVYSYLLFIRIKYTGFDRCCRALCCAIIGKFCIAPVKRNCCFCNRECYRFTLSTSIIISSGNSSFHIISTCFCRYSSHICSILHIAVCKGCLVCTKGCFSCRSFCCLSVGPAINGSGNSICCSLITVSLHRQTHPRQQPDDHRQREQNAQQFPSCVLCHVNSSRHFCLAICITS